MLKLTSFFKYYEINKNGKRSMQKWSYMALQVVLRNLEKQNNKQVKISLFIYDIIKLYF